MKNNEKYRRRAAWWYLLWLPLLCSFTVQGAKNVYFHGALVSEPCVIPPGEESIRLDLGVVLDKYLYLNQRTDGQQFKLHLTECDPTLANMLRVTFNGIENPRLPGLLALDSASQASGIAIGIETSEGKPLPLNMPGQKYPLSKGSNHITLQAYVQGEPEAISKKTIERGPFTAVATFSLEYE